MLFHENNYYHFCFALFKSTKSGRPVSIALNRRATLISINAWKDQLHALKLKKKQKNYTSNFMQSMYVLWSFSYTAHTAIFKIQNHKI